MNESVFYHEVFIFTTKFTTCSIIVILEVRELSFFNFLFSRRLYTVVFTYHLLSGQQSHNLKSFQKTNIFIGGV